MKVLEIEDSTEVAIVMEKDELVSLLHRIKGLGESRYIKYGAAYEHARKSFNFYGALRRATEELFYWRNL